jgi:tetratricopeptide (TPR) repeat protein
MASQSTSNRVAGVSILCYGLGFVFFFAYTLITFQPKIALSSFLWKWTWVQSGILFIQNIVPLQCTALLLSYSLSTPIPRRQPSESLYEPFYRLVNSVLVTLLVFTLIFAALTEGVLPVLQSSHQSMVETTRLARMYMAGYETSLSDQHFADAQRLLALYVGINPSDAAAQAKLDKLKLANEQRDLATVSGTIPAQEETRVENESVANLLDLARGYLKKTDYASAQYYASLVLEIFPKNTDAATIARQALAGLSSTGATPQETAQKAYFAQKSLGANYLQNGNDIDAYYLFHELIKTHPKDPDVVTYLQRATDKVTTYAFFRDEVDRLSVYPGIHDVLFVNKVENGSRELVLLHKVVAVPNGVYVTDVEAMKFDNNGDIAFHFTAPFGKIIGSTLSMYCIDRDQKKSYLPQTISGTLPDTEHYSLPLNVDPQTMRRLGNDFSDFTQYSLPSLWGLLNVLPSVGYSEAPARVEVLRRFLIPFSFLILAILSAGLGWSLRTGGRRPSLLAYLFVPAFPFVVYAFYRFYLWSGTLFFGFLYGLMDFWPTLVTLLACQFALISLALVYLAGRSTES